MKKHEDEALMSLQRIEKGLPRSKTMENSINDLKYPEYLSIGISIYFWLIS